MSETIITNNCYGIQYYSDNNVDYNTPFIGLFMYAPCYIKFLENYQHFINIDMVENKLSRYGIHFTYPIGNIAGCEIHFHHEKNFNDAKAKWDRRKARMAEFKKCILKLCDRDLFNSDILQRFVDLDHPKKYYLFQINGIILKNLTIQLLLKPATIMNVLPAHSYIMIIHL